MKQIYKKFDCVKYYYIALKPLVLELHLLVLVVLQNLLLPLLQLHLQELFA